VFFVLDGLDECPLQERQLILDALLPFLQLSPQMTKLLLVSRKKEDLHTRLESFAHVNINAESNSVDMFNFVLQEVTQAVKQSRLLKGNVSSELKQTIVKSLADDARGI